MLIFNCVSKRVKEVRGMVGGVLAIIVMVAVFGIVFVDYKSRSHTLQK